MKAQQRSSPSIFCKVQAKGISYEEPVVKEHNAGRSLLILPQENLTSERETRSKLRLQYIIQGIDGRVRQSVNGQQV